jgi:hypothetical protein
MTTETLEECPCGHYRYHWAYGLTEVVVGSSQFGWHHTATPEEIAAIEAEISTAIAAFPN